MVAHTTRSHIPIFRSGSGMTALQIKGSEGARQNQQAKLGREVETPVVELRLSLNGSCQNEDPHHRVKGLVRLVAGYHSLVLRYSAIPRYYSCDPPYSAIPFRVQLDLPPLVCFASIVAKHRR